MNYRLMFKFCKMDSIECGVCLKKLSNKSNLNRHITTVHMEMLQPNFVCTTCNRSFVNKWNFSRHNKMHEYKMAKTNLFICDVCQKQFKRKRYVKSHIFICHMDVEKKYICTICNKNFMYKKGLTRHNLIHKHEHRQRSYLPNSNSVFICYVCSANFKTKKNVERHILKFHMNTKVRNKFVQFQMDEHLIEKIRNHQILYNQKLIDHRNHNLRQSIWEEIGKELNISANEAKQRWEELRKYFNKVRCRHRQNIRNGIVGKEKIWKYEEQMAFLLPFLETRKITDNLCESQHFTVMPGESDADDTVPLYSECELDEENREFVQSRELVNEESQNRKELQMDNTEVNDVVKILKDNYAVRKERCENKTNHLQNLDEMDSFFLSMSEVTKQLPKHDQARIKLELSTLLLSRGMQHLNNDLFSSTLHYNIQCSSPSTYCDDSAYSSDCNSAIEVVFLSPPEEN